MGNKINLSGSELVALAGSIAIALSKKLEKEDIRKLKFLFNSICSNLTIIEVEGHGKNKFDC